MSLSKCHSRLTPRMPSHWTTYKIHYRYRQTLRHITLARREANAAGESVLSLDGVVLSSPTLPLVNVQHAHFVEMRA
ncbi:MAG: hypothetical protein WAO71_12105 [Gallionella sp.]